MTLQSLCVLLLALAAACYLLRELRRSACASGCGSCGKPCPVKRLQELEAQSKSVRPS